MRACRSFAVIDDVYCIYVGMLENLPMLRQRYGLTKNMDEVSLIIEMYRSIRDRACYSADQVIGDLIGSFAFVLYDNKAHKLLVASVSTYLTTFFCHVKTVEIRFFVSVHALA